jgi:hypothetical protein
MRVVEGVGSFEGVGNFEGVGSVYIEHRLSRSLNLDILLLRRTSSSHRRLVSATSARTGGGEEGETWSTSKNVEVHFTRTRGPLCSERQASKMDKKKRFE